MKQVVAFVLLCSLVIILPGCTKNSNRSNNSSLIGTWELRELQGGMMPNITYNPGNGNRLIFSNDTYQKFQNNSLVSSGHYDVVNDNSVEQTVGLIVPEGQFRQRIEFENAPKVFFQITGEQLKLLSGFFSTDGGTSSIYKKVSE